MRYPAEHKAEVRNRVLQEAAAAIRAEGPDRIGVAAIMNRAGLTHGGFYAHFKSKDALLADAVDFMFEDVRANFFATEEPDDPQDALSRYVAYYLSMKHRNARDRGCPVPILAGEQHRLPEAARQRFALAVTRMRGRIVTLLERMEVDEASERASSAVAEMVGAVALARMVDDEEARTMLSSARRSVQQKLGLDPAVAD